MLDASRLQEHTPSFQYQPQQPEQDQSRGQARWQEDEDDTIMSPMTQSSRPSTISSVGTIPDFPVPMPPPPAPAPRRSANLGPPPTSRRGASSYYSQASYVSPIPEESPRSLPSHGSYASSAAIPSSWGDESPGYYEDDKYYDERDRGFNNDIIEEGRESRESNLDDNDDRGLIRSASIGKRAKPSMVTTKSSDRTEQRPSPNPQQQQSKLERMGVSEGEMAAGAASEVAVRAVRVNTEQRGPTWPMVGDVNSPLASGTGLIDKSTSSSENEVPTVARALTTDEKAAAPRNPYNAEAANAMLVAYNGASTLQPAVSDPSRTPSPGFSRLSAIRRPPRLDIDAVRDAEARGSLTSLPDLIRRATRLAAMMDRGKRPASRLALDDFPSDGEYGRDKELDRKFQAFPSSSLSNSVVSSGEKRHSGLSGMLAAFPPPGLATPRDGGTPRPVSSWPTGYEADPSSAGIIDQKNKRKGRRCCGLPCCGFLILLLILLIIIAAAVVVPLELLVIHKPKSTTTAALSPLQQCQQNNVTACQNGGSTFLSSGNCACICINGFTGSTCEVASATGCVTTTLTPDYPNVTIGDSIPRLISAAQTNFSIPLFSTVILAHFNSGNLSCLSENALVTFDGLSTRVGGPNEIVVPSSTSDAASSTATGFRIKRDEHSTTAPPSAGTTNGIIYDTSTPVVIPLTSSTTLQLSSSTGNTASTTLTTATSSTSTSTASPSSTFTVTETVLDFARVAVLFVLQQEQLDSAVTAQSSLQHFFSLQTPMNKAARNISLGNSNTINLLDFSLNLGNGTVGSYNSSLASRGLREIIRLW